MIILKNIAVLVSGGGTNLQALIDAQLNGKIRNGKITLVISSKANAYALTRARNAEINSGNDKEKRQDINIETYKKAIELFVKQSTRILVSGDLQIMDKLWIESGRLRYMPLRMKMTFLRLLHDDSIKLGEVNTPQRYVDIFNTLNDNILLWYLNCL